MTLYVGQVWRKHGPCDWLRIKAIHLPDYPGADGGAPGVSVQFRHWKGRWRSQRYFFLANNQADCMQTMERWYNYPEDE